MSLMKFVSEPQTAVRDYFLNLEYNTAVTFDPERRIVIYNDINRDQVSVMAGGGSGHEPYSVGYVGKNLLSGAVAGLIFASPPINTIYDLICTLAEENNNVGVLVVILNYTGDVMNFGVACEKAKTRDIKVEMVIVNEDCSRSVDEVHDVGKRGMCGGCFVMKIAGSMASKGFPLSDIANKCQLVVKNMATIGAAVSSCFIPGKGSLFKMSDNEIDIGLGIHGEAGVEREKLMPIDDLIDFVLSKVMKTLHMSANSRACVIINNLGSTSQLEMGIISSKVQSSLSKVNVEVTRLYNGTFVTSLDMAGFQVSILDVTGHEEWLHYLDTYTDAPAWNSSEQNIPLRKSTIAIKSYDVHMLSKVGPKFTSQEASVFVECLRTISRDLKNEESRLNTLDSATGDGDTGSTLRRFADGLNSATDLQYEYPAVSFSQLAKIAQDLMGGVSGAIYSFLLSGAAQYLISAKDINWILVWKAALETLSKYSTAKLGDRTLVDALLPAYEEFSKHVQTNEDARRAYAAAVTVAKIKCKETKHMKPKLGRASYVPEKYVTDVDPGAYAVTIWLNSICKVLESSYN